MPPLHETAPTGPDTLPLLLCLSHLRWDFVVQRPQHLLTRAGAHYRVVFLEEPVPGGACSAPARSSPALRAPQRGSTAPRTKAIPRLRDAGQYNSG